ncbi:hypothetical protein EVAR_14846_1 [Eumeta japonica]|uniref:Uncharacterized protein n=1 Tax=Eumeta variegata TaxID=151549 RepID=A0A4C1V4K3_EUMVA|nr:hypothetical protein EVAR_14846_1 [Eumeta japonica]
MDHDTNNGERWTKLVTTWKGPKGKRGIRPTDDHESPWAQRPLSKWINHWNISTMRRFQYLVYYYINVAALSDALPFNIL